MNQVQASYNAISDQWDEFRKRTQVNPCIIDFIKLLKPNSTILDIGCGTGYPISAYLTEHGFYVTGIDISEKMIEKANHLHLNNADFYVEDILKFKSSKKYDAAIAFDSIWHIEHDKQEKVYETISSLLNSEGFLLFTHGKVDGEVVGQMFGQEFYYSALDVSKVHHLLQNNGFRIISSIEDYKEEGGERDLIVVAQKGKNRELEEFVP
jgi:2-polyprenyl-3-methyl-5-hydroxy-6-metoxy-1,4-benzoquinol methylase